MYILENKKILRFIYIFIFSFFLIRLSSHINIFEKKFETEPQKWVNFCMDVTSLLIMIFLLLNIAYYILSKKKISISIIFVIYPFIGAIAYYFNGYSNNYQESIIIHQFITLLSFFLYFTLVESNKIFNLQFKELILKIILIFVFIFFLFNILPNIVIDIYSGNDLRTSMEKIVHIFGAEIRVKQNVNGQTKFIFILLVVVMYLFKKFLPKKKIVSLAFFMTGILLISVIFLAQARLNMITSILFSFFLIISIRDLNFKKKLGCLLLTIIIPLFFVNNYQNLENRFNNKYKVEVEPFQNINEFKNLEKKIDNREKNYNIQNDLSEKDLIKLITTLKKKNNDNWNGTRWITNSSNTIEEIKKIIAIYNNKSKKFILKKTDQKKFIIRLNYDDYINNVNLKHILKNLILDSGNDNGQIIELKKLFEQINKITNLQKEMILRSCSKFLLPVDNLLSGRVCGWQILLNIIIADEVIILGKGFLADQFYLKHLEKVASNSFVNILFNAGFVSFLIYIVFILYFFIKYFKFRNLNHENFYISISHYYFLYFIFRSFFEDTIAFVSIDLLLLGVSSILIKQNHDHINN
jgi:hypothetical protein